MDKLIPYDNKQLQKVSNAIAVTYKLLALVEPQLIPYRKGDKWGFCTVDKKIVIDCVYDQTDPFINDFANVEKNWKFGLIDKNGKVVLPCVYESRFNMFTDGLACAKQNNKWGFINKNNEVIIPINYDSASPFSEGLARVYKNRKYGFIDIYGNVVIPLIYDNVHSFQDGFANIRIGDLWGIIDKMGKEIIPVKLNSLQELDDLNIRNTVVNPMKVVEINGKYQIFNRTNELINLTFFDNVNKYGFNELKEFLDVQINTKWGFMDVTGNLIIPCIYDDVCFFSDGLVSILKDGLWGCIDKSGKEILPFKYKSNFIFERGLALIQNSNNYCDGYINKEGTEYWDDY